MQQTSDKELSLILDLAKSAPKGPFVEFGCYEGDTSLELARVTSNLYLYDSFAGLPDKSPEDSSPAGDQFQKGSLLTTRAALVRRFKKANLPLPIIKKAFFEDLSPSDVPSNIAFAFLDGDLYSSIKTSLKLITGKMQSGGIIIVHDYTNPALPGASRAVDEYLKGHPLPLRVAEGLAIIAA